MTSKFQNKGGAFSDNKSHGSFCRLRNQKQPMCIKPLELPDRRTTSQTSGGNEARRKSNDIDTTFSELSTANLNETTRDVEKPAKIKWTFLDERQDARLSTACRKFRQVRHDRIQTAENQALLQSQPTRASSNFNSSAMGNQQFDASQHQSTPANYQHFMRLRSKNYSETAVHSRSMGIAMVTPLNHFSNHGTALNIQAKNGNQGPAYPASNIMTR